MAMCYCINVKFSCYSYCLVVDFTIGSTLPKNMRNSNHPIAAMGIVTTTNCKIMYNFTHYITMKYLTTAAGFLHLQSLQQLQQFLILSFSVMVVLLFGKLFFFSPHQFCMLQCHGNRRSRVFNVFSADDSYQLSAAQD